ncbi:MAG: tRNA glutamyl-Q(34) synthetase GluQRS [Rhodobacteraceae bacterium]|nr:tRNA glutamyl-Q(34) synthetase GluQRS [Paracoccaceae bacterium]
MAWPELTWRERFAPSPTGPLHLGHAYSALIAWDQAQKNGGEFMLRIEDIDLSRCRLRWETQIFEDLEWLGIHWPKPVLRQSLRLSAYRDALFRLWREGLLYPCRCTRKDITAAASAPQEGPEIHGPDGLVYPGTCRNKIVSYRDYPLPDSPLRLNMAMAGFYGESRSGAEMFYFTESGAGPNGETGLIEFSAEDALLNIGDIVLARREMGTSYHLSVVLDDAFQGVSHVSRGEDLFEATKIHVILQKILGLPTPVYHHHALIRDETGKRLAKRDDARAISKYREEGASARDIRQMVGL